MAAKTKAVIKAAEKTLDEIEPVLDRIESELDQTAEAAVRIPKLRLNGTTRKQQILILSLTAGVAAATTAVVVWKVATKRAELKYEEVLKEEIAQTKAFYQNLNKPPLESLGITVENPQELTDDELKAAAKVLRDYQGTKLPYEAPKVEVPEEVTQNIFVEGQPMLADAFDYDTEVPLRSEDAPYVITYDEFVQGEKEYSQATLRWYDGDDVLTDDKNIPIEQVDMTVGDCVHKFGHGSKDPRIVYVRNEVMEQDFEVVKDDNAFASHIAGFRHSIDRPGSRKTRRMPRDDEG